jgi:hypothetical protein
MNNPQLAAGTTDPGSYVVTLCEQAASCIRTVNHLTYPDDRANALSYPADVYQALCSIGLLCERLPQALRQLTHCFTRQVDEDAIVIDTGTPYEGAPDRAAEDLRAYLGRDAIPSLRAAAIALNHAVQALAHAATAR